MWVGGISGVTSPRSKFEFPTASNGFCCAFVAFPRPQADPWPKSLQSPCVLHPGLLHTKQTPAVQFAGFFCVCLASGGPRGATHRPHHHPGPEGHRPRSERKVPAVARAHTCSTLHCAAPHCTVPHRNALCHGAPHHAVPRRTAPCHAAAPAARCCSRSLTHSLSLSLPH